MKSLLLLLIFLATVPNLGFFSLPAFLILTIAFVLFLVVLSGRGDGKRTDRSVLFGLLALSLLFYGGLYQEKPSLDLGYFLIFGVIGLNLFALLKNNEKIWHWTLMGTVIAYVILSVWTIVYSPAPAVDVFVILKEAPLKLLSGINPYATTYSRVYANISPNYFSYLPFSFLATLPFVLIFSDPRFLTIVANLISTFVICRFFKGRKDLGLCVAIFLFLPRSFYILEHSYLDPMIFALFLVGFYFAAEKKKNLFSFCLSVVFFIKQDIWLLFPLIRGKISRIYFLLIPISITLVFFFWDSIGFIKNVFLIYGPKEGLAPVMHSLSLPTFLGGHYIIGGILFIGFYLLTVFSKKNTVFFRMAAVLFFFNYFLYHSYFNHYYQVAQFLFLDMMFVNSNGRFRNLIS